MGRAKNTCTALVAYKNDLPTAFMPAFEVTNEVLSTKCGRCESTTPPKTYFITCVDGCCSCDQCPKELKNADFWYRKKGGVLSCTNRMCQAAALPMPVENKAYATAKVALEEVDTALKHGVSLIKEKGYTTELMEQGEAAPDWVPIPKRQAMLQAKAEIASEVSKMKSEGKSAKAIEAFICGTEVDEEDGEEGEEEADEPATKRKRKEPTADQLERREARKIANRKKREQNKRDLAHYPVLKHKYNKLRSTVASAREELLAEKSTDEVNALLGDESEEEEESADDRSDTGVVMEED